MTLIDKVAIVLGGTGGLGSSVTRRLATEGCHVYATYHSEKGMHGAIDLQPLARMMKADATDEAQVRHLFDAVTKESQKVDIVVNAVGGYLPQKSLTDVSMTDWDGMMTINLKTAFLSTREALRRMVGQSYGRIINVSAMTGVRPMPERIPYSISKASVSLLTELVAQEVKGSGITVNAIAPSIIATAANLASMPSEDSSQWVTPDQIADLIVFLCSPSAAAITGTTIKASGGV